MSKAIRQRFSSIGSGRGHRRWFPCILFLALVAAPGCVQDSTDGTARKDHTTGFQQASLILVTLDTTRADHLEPYGATDVATPTLAALAESGIVFDHAVAATPVTAPSHASLLTGLYPPRHGVRNNSTHYLANEITTLAEVMADAGYRTAAFVSTVILDQRYGLDQGFEIYDDDIRSGAGLPERRLTSERRGDHTVDRALAWLDGLDTGSPYFLWVHLYDPHIPYVPPAPWDEQYPDRPYDGEIAFMDSQIGRLLEHPRADSRQALVMAVGDHGESLGEHGEKTHGLLVYDATLRVPWIVRLPDGPAGLHIDTPVSQVDLVPTVLDVLAIETPVGAEAFDGSSLLPLIRNGGRLPERLLFAESEVPFFAYGWAPLRSVRNRSLKLIDAPVTELYDLDVDPDELHDLADDRPADVQRLLSALEAWSTDRSESGTTLTVDAETAGMLRALGYTTGDTGRPAGEGHGNPVELMPVHDELQVVGRLLSEGRPKEAVERVRDALEMDPHNLAALRDLSRGLVQLGQLNQAAEAAGEATSVAPWSAEAWTIAADIESRRGRSERALELVDRALELDPRFLEARIDRSRYLVAVGRTAEAAAELNRLLEEEPANNWVALRYAELVELPDGDFGAAEQRLRAVISRNPSFTEAWLLLGTVLSQADRPNDAAAVYREAAAVGALDAEARIRLALRLAEARDPAAEPVLRDAIRDSEAVRPELHVAYAEVLASEGRRNEARQHLELAARAPASTGRGRNDRAKALMLLGRTDEAEAEWRELTRERPEDWRAWANLAAVSIQRGDWGEAVRFGQEAVAQNPAASEAWNALAIGLDELGRTAEAESAYRRAAELDPGNWQALFNLGILLRQQQRYDEAAVIQEQVLARAPDNAGANFELGALYAGPLHDPERARAHLEATIAADPDNPLALQARAILERLP